MQLKGSTIISIKHIGVIKMDEEVKFNGYVTDPGALEVKGGRTNFGNVLFFCEGQVLLAKKGKKGFWFDGMLVPGGQKLNTANKYVFPGGAEKNDMTVRGLVVKELRDETGINLLGEDCGNYDAHIAKFSILQGPEVLFVAFVELESIDVLQSVRRSIQTRLRQNDRCREDIQAGRTHIRPFATQDDELSECIVMPSREAIQMENLCSWHKEILRYHMKQEAPSAASAESVVVAEASAVETAPMDAVVSGPDAADVNAD